MHCSKCGAPLSPGAQFCNNCGAPVQAAGQQPQYQAPQYGSQQTAPVRAIGFGEAIRNFFTQYATFSGRATRSEYWWIVLFNAIVNAAISMVIGLIQPDLVAIVSGLYSLAILIPTLALIWRRLHDIGKRGTWYLMILIPLVGWIFVIVYFCTASGPDNQYGRRKI